jgi:GNAT superfamily N-acetyltransferase
MKVRLAEARDRDAIFGLGRRYGAELKGSGFRFEEARAGEVFKEYLETAHPTIFVVEDKSGVVGFLVATIQPFLFMAGLWTHTDVIFVTPEKRGTRAAAELLAEFDRWSTDIGAVMSLGGNSNSIHTKRTASLYGKFGYQPVGVAMAKFRSGA